MIEFVISCFKDFVLFSFIEGMLYILFLRNVIKINDIGILKDGFIIGLINCFISQTFPPLIYQSVMILCMSLYFKSRIKDCSIEYFKMLKIITFMMFAQLITEMLYAMFYEYILKYDIFNSTEYETFKIMIPIRIIQIILIYGGDKMKGWLGTGVERQ